MLNELVRLCTLYKHFIWHECDLNGNIKSNGNHIIIEWVNNEFKINFNKVVNYVKFDFYINNNLVESSVIDINSDSINLLVDVLPSYHKIERSSTYVHKESRRYVRHNTPHIEFNPRTYRYMTDAEYLDKIDYLIIRDRARTFIKNNYMDMYLYAKYLEMEQDDLYLNGYKISVSKL